jgi:hypothetical protein
LKSYYTPATIKRRLRFKELTRSGVSLADFFEDLEYSLERIKSGNFDFNITKKKDYFKLDDLVHKVILRQVNHRLKKTYKDYQSNRRLIISQIVALLLQESEYYIIRSDVSSFYESIDKSLLLNKLKGDRILNYESIYLIEKIFDNADIAPNGLPRGLSISSTLSEIYMRGFDKRIKQLEGVYFYARFVDDIIIFATTKDIQKEILRKIPDWLPKGLCINIKKTMLSSSSQLMQGKCFEYLGYKFEIEKFTKKEFQPKISIAEKKLKKIKSRISYSFASYCKNGDFELLLKRIDFLSCNYVLRGGEKSKLMAGISYNYSKLTHHSDLEELNSYYHKILNSVNNEFGIRIQASLSLDQLNNLKKCSFKHRFKNKVVKKFTPEEILKIKKCWAHEN